MKSFQCRIQVIFPFNNVLNSLWEYYKIRNFERNHKNTKFLLFSGILLLYSNGRSTATCGKLNNEIY